MNFAGIVYISMFGMASILAMMLMSAVLSHTLSAAAGPRAGIGRTLPRAVASASVVFGICYAVSVFATS